LVCKYGVWAVSAKEISGRNQADQTAV